MGDVRTLRVFRAAPGYWRYITVGWLITQVGDPDRHPRRRRAAGHLRLDLDARRHPGGHRHRPGTLLVFVLQLGVTYFSLRLNYEMRWYKVTDRSLRIRTGVWNVSEMTMTFDNIQNITVTQGPLERLFGISDVRVTTAGGGEAAAQKKSGHGGVGQNLHLGVFRGVDNPDEIRDLMLARLRRLRDTGLGDPTDDHSHDAAGGLASAARALQETRRRRCVERPRGSRLPASGSRLPAAGSRRARRSRRRRS